MKPSSLGTFKKSLLLVLTCLCYEGRVLPLVSPGHPSLSGTPSCQFQISQRWKRKFVNKLIRSTNSIACVIIYVITYNLPNNNDKLMTTLSSASPQHSVGSPDTGPLLISFCGVESLIYMLSPRRQESL